MTSSKDTSIKPVHNIITDHPQRQQKQNQPVNRRHFLQGVGVGVAGLSLIGCGGSDDSPKLLTTEERSDTVAFEYGVASGDPLSNGVVLWTRVSPRHQQSKIAVKWVIAKNQDMTQVLQSGTVYASAGDDFTVHVDVKGLEPNTVYYYQFLADTVKSRVGKTKTLPVGNIEQVKLAVFSCANYPAGFFHAYADAQKRDDLDAWVHLGDYIYEYGRTEKAENGVEKPAYASAHAAEIERQVQPANELQTITDYRKRYAQYRTDKDLQALHAKLPLIAVWDDHEFANDAYKDGADNHQENEGDWQKRKLAAMKAYHEWLPIRKQSINKIYRSFDFGQLLSLYMLDTRIIGRDKPLDYRHYVTQDGFNAEAFKKDLLDSNREMMELEQQNWLAEKMIQSKSTWQVLGQQVIMGSMLIPSPILLNFQNAQLGVDLQNYAKILQKAKLAPTTLSEQEQAILSAPNIPYNLDAWDGYVVAREKLLGMSKQLGKNLVVLSGDTHNAWANDLKNIRGEPVGVEFATSSVTSPGFEAYLPNVPPEQLAATLPHLVEGGTLKYANTHQRGYIILTVTPEKCQSDWVFVSDILKPTYSAAIGKSMFVVAGENQLKDMNAG